MNNTPQIILLASGIMLKQGQVIRLADKIRESFPRLKGNVLPIRNFKFCEDESKNFKYVQLLLEDETRLPAHQSLSLLADTIEYFAKEDNMWHAYTRFFRVSLAPALHSGEIALMSQPDSLEKDRKELDNLVENCNDQITYYHLGLNLHDDLLRNINNECTWFLQRRGLWRFKAAQVGMMGGTAAQIMDF